MTSIWLVTRGEYSDFGVICAAKTRDLAEEIRVRLGADDVEELRLLSRPDEAIELVSYSAWARVDHDGRLGVANGSQCRDYEPPGRARAWSNAVEVGVQVQAETPEKALRAAKEYATELGAELAAGVPVRQAVSGFNARHGGDADAVDTPR